METNTPHLKFFKSPLKRVWGDTTTWDTLNRVENRKTTIAYTNRSIWDFVSTCLYILPNLFKSRGSFTSSLVL